MPRMQKVKWSRDLLADQHRVTFGLVCGHVRSVPESIVKAMKPGALLAMFRASELMCSFCPDPSPIDPTSNEKRPQAWWDQWFLTLAAHVATASKDTTKCGAVIASYRHEIISVGYNGFPRGFDDAVLPELDREERLARMVHAEVNAALFAGRLPEACTLYTFPLPPCDRCVVQMIQAGLRRFVARVPTPEHRERWNIARTEEFMREVGAKLIYIEP